MVGLDPKAHQDRGQVLYLHADAQPIGSNPSDRELLLASLAGMRQLQGVVADTGRKDRDDSNSPTHPLGIGGIG